MSRNLRTPGAAAFAALSLVAACAASARPEYALKEHKLCSYCHVNPAGGGPRNAAGIYYGSHNHSFAGYVAAGPTGPPVYQAAWKLAVPGDTRRIAVANVAADKTPRLLTLGAGTSLSIDRLTTDGITTEATVDLGPRAKEFEAGRFAQGAPDLIVAPGALVYRDGDRYTRKAVPALTSISGMAAFVDGSEAVFALPENADGAPQTWSIDLASDKLLTPAKPLVPPQNSAGYFRRAVLRAPPETLAGMGVPPFAAAVGVVGGLDPRADGHWYLFAPIVNQDASFLALTGLDASGQPDPKPVWTSPRISGKILDVAMGADPKGSGKTGFFILETNGSDNNRVVEFFALQ